MNNETDEDDSDFEIVMENFLTISTTRLSLMILLRTETSKTTNKTTSGFNLYSLFRLAKFLLHKAVVLPGIYFFCTVKKALPMAEAISLVSFVNHGSSCRCVLTCINPILAFVLTFFHASSILCSSLFIGDLPILFCNWHII